jgi:hypothetical protein
MNEARLGRLTLRPPYKTLNHGNDGATRAGILHERRLRARKGWSVLWINTGKAVYMAALAEQVTDDGEIARGMSFSRSGR